VAAFVPLHLLKLLGRFYFELHQQLLLVCCTVMQCVAVCCGVLRCVAVGWSLLQCVTAFVQSGSISL